MHTVTVKNIPSDLYDRLKRAAQENRRSINSEIIMCIERSFKSHRIDVEQFLKEVDALRNEMSGPPLTDKFLNEAKQKGRP